MSIANTIIQVKKSGVSGNVPVSLNHGELALNYYDGKLYYKNAGSTISYISSGDATKTFATVNANSSLLIATSNTDILSFAAGNNISITSDIVKKIINVSLNDEIVVGNITVPTIYTTVGGIVFPDGTIQTSSAGGSVIDHQAREVAQSAYNQANTATIHAEAAYEQANVASRGAIFIMVDSNISLLPNQSSILANTSNGSINILLPNVTSSNIGHSVAIGDGGGSKDINPAYIDGNGKTINDSNDTLSFNIPGILFRMVYTGTTWKVLLNA